jgi:glycosyltransferase involved in cell wall biosynthesis
MLGPVRVAVVVPCYQAGRHVAGVVRSLPAFVDDVIVVDDGSPTPTSEALAAATDPRVVLLRHDVNRGLARAMATGYTAALERGAQVVVKMDGDGQMDPVDLPRLIAPIADGDADFCKGNRFLHRRLMEEMPLLRRGGNLVLSFLAKAATGYWHIFDPTNGYVAVRRELLEAIDFDRLGPGYFFEISLLREACLAGAVAADVPIAARYGDEESHLSIGRVLVAFPVHLAASVVRRLGLRYFLWDFSPVGVFIVAGLPPFAFGLLFGVWQWVSRMGTLTPTPIGTLLLAALPLVLGFQLLLQAWVMDIGNVPSRSRWARGMRGRDRVE